VPAVAPGQVGHQRDVAVGARRDAKALAQTRQAGADIGPGIEAVPGPAEISAYSFGHAVQAQGLQHMIEIAPVQCVELGERNRTAAHVLHRRLVARTPGVGKALAVERRAVGRKRRTGLAGYAAAPIDQGAEDVEDQRLDIVQSGNAVQRHALTVASQPMTAGGRA
jgi:hypothetical protein